MSVWLKNHFRPEVSVKIESSSSIGEAPRRTQEGLLGPSFINPIDRLLKPTTGDNLPQLMHYCFSGDPRRRDGLRILVSGEDATETTLFLAEQLRDNRASITHLSPCEDSLKLCRERAFVRELEGISWVPGTWDDLPNLSLGRFDYIKVEGLLYRHTAVDEQFKVLAEALQTDGALSLGLYTRSENFLDNQELRSIIDAASGKKDDMHWGIQRDKLQELLQQTQHLGFAPSQLNACLANQGLHLVGDVTKSTSRAAPQDSPSYPTHPGAQPLTHGQQSRSLSAIGELMGQVLQRQRLYISKRQESTASSHDVSLVPFFVNLDAHALKHRLLSAKDGPTTLRSSEGQVQLEIDPVMRLFIEAIDGERSVKSVLTKVHEVLREQGLDQTKLVSRWVELFDFFHTMGCMFLRQSLDRHVPSRPLLKPVPMLLH
jgi:hypothetical protein